MPGRYVFAPFDLLGILRLPFHHRHKPAAVGAGELYKLIFHLGTVDDY